MGYLTIYETYSFSDFSTGHSADIKGRSLPRKSKPFKEWDTKLTTYTKQGYKIVTSGAVPMGDYIAFWALLEKPEETPKK